MWSDDTLQEIAKMLRLYHDTVSNFSIEGRRVPIDNNPQSSELLCHNDFNL